MPMFCFFLMECRRWAPTSDLAGFSRFPFYFGYFEGCWIDGSGLIVHGFCRDAGKYIFLPMLYG